MTFIMHILPALAAIAASVAFFVLIVLVMRNPHVPAWVHDEPAAQAVALIMTLGIIVGFAFAAEMLMSVGMHVLAALIVTTVAVVVVSMAIFLLFHVRQRLRLADQGYSPFMSLHGHVGMPGHGTA